MKQIFSIVITTLVTLTILNFLRDLVGYNNILFNIFYNLATIIIIILFFFSLIYSLLRIFIFRPKYLVTVVLKNGEIKSYTFTGGEKVYQEQLSFLRGRSNRIINIKNSDGSVDVLSLYDVKNYDIKLTNPSIYYKVYSKIKDNLF
ncbi:hypothetical protein HZY83_03060 [Gemella sp. GH3]|uniref:hypothetical protein n=1 Tax=unclassified Gemella TaxID=2624949 RepID=UPI0015CFB70A|nr:MULTISPECIES: hypothetical protein [unclassified Gemella]MBF0713660.1 hypothetical protein [Gemella sp. GH3.1]NYS50612.1 hypothetical protein [Gemella sp. GH3]